MTIRSKSIVKAFKRLTETPLGTVLGFGYVTDDQDLIRTKCSVSDNRVILYALYKFVEKCNDYREFTLAWLMNDSIDRDGVSPTRIFGLDYEDMKSILLGLSARYPDYIDATFTNDLDKITINIVFIDALSTPLGNDDFDSYIEYSAMAQYYQGNNNQSSKENANKAAQVLSIAWRNRIYNGSFILYYDDCRDGEKVVGASGVASVLQTIVVNKHKMVFDFSRGLTENQLKLTQAKAAAKCGIVGKTSGVVINAEKSLLKMPPQRYRYKDWNWTIPACCGMPI